MKFSIDNKPPTQIQIGQNRIILKRFAVVLYSLSVLASGLILLAMISAKVDNTAVYIFSFTLDSLNGFTLPLLALLSSFTIIFILIGSGKVTSQLNELNLASPEAHTLIESFLTIPKINSYLVEVKLLNRILTMGEITVIKEYGDEYVSLQKDDTRQFETELMQRIYSSQ